MPPDKVKARTKVVGDAWIALFSTCQCLASTVSDHHGEVIKDVVKFGAGRVDLPIQHICVRGQDQVMHNLCVYNMGRDAPSMYCLAFMEGPCL